MNKAKIKRPLLNKQVKILLLGSNIWYLGEGMLGPLFAVFAQKIGGNILDIAWAWSSYLVVTGVLNIIVGKYSDGPARKAKLMVLGYAMNAICTFGYLLVQTQTGLLLVQVSLGVATALATPTWSALYAKYEDKRHDGLLWGLANGQASIIVGIATFIGGLIVNYFSFQVLFIIMGTIQVVATIVQAKILEPGFSEVKKRKS